MKPEENLSPYAGLAAKIRSGKSASTKEFESRPPELIVRRGYDGSAGRGIAGKLLMAYRNSVAASAFRVLIDDEEIGQLGQETGLKIQLAPGLRRIRVITPLAASNEICHEFGNGDRLTLNCRTKLVGIVLYK